MQLCGEPSAFMQSAVASTKADASTARSGSQSRTTACSHALSSPQLDT
jgi:hypothetical protein